MQRRRTRQPSYCLHKATGQAYVTLNGKEHYLGLWGSRESKDAYDSLIAQWLAGGRSLPQPRATPAEVKPESRIDPAPAPAGPSVKAIILAYLEHAERHYRGPDGKPTDELKNLVDALRPVRKLFSDSPAVDFGALALRGVREDMIRSGLARKTINARVHRIRRSAAPRPVARSVGQVGGVRASGRRRPPRPPDRPRRETTLAAAGENS
jgi:hypothetical protein